MNSHKKAQKSAKKTAFTLIARTGSGLDFTTNRRKINGLTPRSAAFTLIELLTVIMVLGILFGFLTAAISKARENAKRGRVDSDVRTLGAAIWAYRHEYGQWPCDEDHGVHEFSDNNQDIKDYMGDHNERHIDFVNWSEYLTDGDGNLVDPWGTAYFIVLNIDSDTVTVSNATTGATKTL